jgi:hypothetical protein
VAGAVRDDAYNLVLILPATLLVAFGEGSLARSLRLGRRPRWILGLAIILSIACLHLYKVGPRATAKRFAPAALGLVGMTAIAGTCGALALRRRAIPAAGQ